MQNKIENLIKAIFSFKSLLRVTIVIIATNWMFHDLHKPPTLLKTDDCIVVYAF